MSIKVLFHRIFHSLRYVMFGISSVILLSLFLCGTTLCVISFTKLNISVFSNLAEKLLSKKLNTNVSIDDLSIHYDINERAFLFFSDSLKTQDIEIKKAILSLRFSYFSEWAQGAFAVLKAESINFAKHNNIYDFFNSLKSKPRTYLPSGIEVVNTKLNFRDPCNSFRIKSVNITPFLERQKPCIEAEISMGNNVKIHGVSRLSKKESSWNIDNLDLKTIEKIGLPLPTSYPLEASFSGNTRIDSNNAMNFNLNATGHFNEPFYLIQNKEKVKIKLKGEYNKESLTSSLHATFSKNTIRGSVNLHGKMLDYDLSFTGHRKLSNITLSDIEQIKELELLSEGYIKKARISTTNSRPFEREFVNKSTKVSGDIKDGKLKIPSDETLYIDDLDFQLNYCDNKLSIKQTSNQLSTIEDVIIKELTMDFEKNNKKVDIVFLGTVVNTLKTLDKIYKKDLPNFKEVAGEAETLCTILVKDSELDHITLTSKISNFKATNLVDEFSLSNGNLYLTYENDDIFITGTTDVNDIEKVNLSLNANLETKDYQYQLDCVTPLEKFIQLKKELYFPHLIENPEGNIQLHFSHESSLSSSKTLLEGNLKDAKFSIPFISIEKKNNENSHFKFELENNNQLSFNIHIPDLRTEGTAVINDNNTIESLISKNILLHEYQFNADYSCTTQGHEISLYQGAFPLFCLNYQRLFDHSLRNSNANIIIHTQLDKLILENEYILYKPEFSLSYISNSIINLCFKGFFTRYDYVKYIYDYPNFSIYSNNLGHLLKAFDISQKVEGGLLSLSGKWSDAKKWTGILDIRNCTNFNSSTLMKIFSAIKSLSFTHLIKALGGQGIRFDIMKSKLFGSNNGNVVFEDLFGNGPDISLKGKGEISFPNNTLSFLGTMKTKDPFTGILKKIPVIGQLTEVIPSTTSFKVKDQIFGSKKDNNKTPKRNTKKNTGTEKYILKPKSN